MKKKEKLALEWAEKNPLPPWTEVGTIDRTIPGFIAGFEAAREMAKADVINWLEVTGVLPKGTSYYNELVYGFDDLGEEEV